MQYEIYLSVGSNIELKSVLKHAGPQPDIFLLKPFFILLSHGRLRLKYALFGIYSQ
jgi:hypothetical protein